VEALVGQGAQVRAFVRYNSRGDPGLLADLPPDIQKQLDIVAGDLRDPEAVRTAARQMDVIFHLGALIAIPYSYVHPREVVETNVLGTLNVLSAAREWGIARVVHTSTSEVYGTARRVPIDEEHPLQGQSPYSASKIGADKIAESFQRSFDLPICVIRPFNAYGPRQSARAVIPTIISQALTFNEVRLGALHPVRDFTFVTDTVRGFLAVAESQHSIGQEINIGSGVEISIGDLASRIIALIGRPVRVVTEPDRLRPPRSEVDRLLSDNRKAKDISGWEPQVGLEDGLRATIDWVSRNLSRYRPDAYEI
jgi:dTDP-glucose 4,6-dehydratase